MPPVNLGLHFDGIGSLPRLKLRPQIARKMLLEAHRWTAKEALADGVVDAIAGPEQMLDAALELARKWAPKAKMGYVRTFSWPLLLREIILTSCLVFTLCYDGSCGVKQLINFSG